MEAPPLSEPQSSGSDAALPIGAPTSPAGQQRPSPTGRAACPFLRLEVDGTLGEPLPAASDDMRCVAIAGPRVLSRQQQDLVCLRAGHVDCPRYRRATTASAPDRGAVHALAVPRAILASLVVLGVSAVLSFGFVMARGGIDLPAPSATAAAAVVSASAAAPTDSSGGAPSPSAVPSGTSEPAATPVPTPAATPSPASTPPPERTATPIASGSPSPGVPSASRLAVLKPCPDQSGCYLYTVRSGDNLFSIAHWFGVPLDTIYAWNPTVKGSGIRPGMVLKIPTPTR